MTFDMSDNNVVKEGHIDKIVPVRASQQQKAGGFTEQQ